MAERETVRVFLSSASETAVRMTSYPAILNATVRDEDFPLLMPRWGYVVSAFVLFLIGFFGFFLNLMVILLMFKDRQLWTPLNVILFNLVCSDFSVSVLGNPLTLTSALFHRWIFGKTMCMLYGFFMALLGITSITTLTVISFERYLMVTRPLSRRHLTSRGAVGSVMFIWLYSLALTTPPLYGWGNYVNEAANISCSVNWHEQSYNTLTYILFLFAMGQIVPFAVITFSYVNIIRTMKRNSQRLGRVNRAEARATAMVFIMIIAFTVAWTPYSVFALMEQFATQGIISPGAGVIPALVAKSSICYDPLIYVGMNTQFRQSIKRLFGIHGKRDSPDRKYNNTVTSPAHRLTSFNDITVKFNCDHNSSAVNKKRNRNHSIADDLSEVTNHENQAYQRNVGLCTIQENKTGSDAERSGDTLCDEDSNSNSNKRNQNSDASTGKTTEEAIPLCDESVNLLVDNPSHILTIVDTEQTIFCKRPGKEFIDMGDLMDKVYGNHGYEDHSSDITNPTSGNKKDKRLQLTHSYSLELHGSATEKRRKQSVDAILVEPIIRKQATEAKIDFTVQPKNLFKDRKVVTKFFDQGSNQTNDNFQSYLFNKDEDEGIDNL